jgi:hypothetical protein
MFNLTNTQANERYGVLDGDGDCGGTHGLRPTPGAWW